ncbi:uncharacterized protein CTHT_0040120 [Thermochaetoides thermophila DSM 1495]|uniref:Uncharacterized protein n=1 Tax=Chaetomium thermophilum (strain DSM 1495 / CBS 144.50 / IMI 039719) TaxID=759272 RepID=G0S8S0_CHATD|nr:hypothetical protein CTHT_0040120 [Thermochaetoides thermophila DSM 1495]EGS20273.1 hypothetical protein CTHT_0040120 [Thermochaetoides thermophila DSM 1495]
MSDILEAIKDILIPRRRSQATAETYDAQRRGPFADPNLTSQDTQQVRAAQATGNQTAERPQAQSRRGTRTSSVDSTSEYSQPSYPEVGEYAGTTTKPVHKEGGKYGLS